MIYLDTSVALAELFAEDVTPPREIWHQPLISSRLLQYELWTRVNGRKLAKSHGDAARDILARIHLVEMSSDVLARAIDRFPKPVRTLDALHLASIEYLRKADVDVTLATYDQRMRTAARALKIPQFPL